ncbi:hypothetical protein CEXT_304991 [Caerostris extrusa]|uniref:Secreted protein n=1 Tax=Caerostris extrusa TaxID=172846 RepID=A0AAV4XUH1_CAEEX|nr:hypothetical protein CEXT_304991 [Caerostris extrusa]
MPMMISFVRSLNLLLLVYFSMEIPPFKPTLILNNSSALSSKDPPRPSSVLGEIISPCQSADPLTLHKSSIFCLPHHFGLAPR